MTLVHPLFASNDRLQRAARNSPVLRRGDRGSAVALLQEALVSLGQALPLSTRRDGSMDGGFGGDTVRALKTFQRGEGLLGDNDQPDGIAGNDTLHAMDRRLVARGGALRPAVVAAQAGPVIQREDPAEAVPERFQIERVTGAGLFAGYQALNDSANGGLPCRRGRDGNGSPIVRNQCAVRLSLALASCRAGFTIDRTQVTGRHSGARNCGGIAPHVAASQDLANYLDAIGFRFTRHRKDRGDREAGRLLHDRYAGSHGIAFFHQLDTPTPGSGNAGNHIDYVRLGVCMNEHFHFNTRDEPGRTERYFRQCGDVWFATIPAG